MGKIYWISLGLIHKMITFGEGGGIVPIPDAHGWGTLLLQHSSILFAPLLTRTTDNLIGPFRKKKKVC